MAVINAASGLNVNLVALQAKVADVAVRAALDAMVIAGTAAIEVELSRSSHSVGEPTGSAAPNPPARVSGRLARDVVATPVILMAGGLAMTTVGSTAPYARVQEFGGTIRPIKAHRLFWIGMGGGHAANSVTLPARPYLKPALDSLIASGELGKVASAAFLAALMA